jgi:hypothetical protein
LEDNVYSVERIEKEIKRLFNGTNPADTARERLAKMSKEELEDLFHVAVQLLGVTMKDGDFEDELDAMVGMCMSLDLIFENYDKDQFLKGATTRREGIA